MHRNRPAGGSDSLQAWWNDVPVLTKFFLVGTVALSVLTQFKFVQQDSLLLIWPYVTEKKELWRLVTTFFYAGSFSFNFLIHCMVFYENCRRYELNPMNTGAGGNSADFLWMILVTSTVLLAAAYFFDLYLLTEPLLYVIMYIWSRRESFTMVNIFGFTFQAFYLPWVYIAIRLFMGGEITEPLMGIAVGHFYYFLVETFPMWFGFRIIRTPKFCSDLVEYATGFTPVAANPVPVNINVNQFPTPGVVPPPPPAVPSVPSPAPAAAQPPVRPPVQPAGAQPAPQPAGQPNTEEPANNLRYRGRDQNRPEGGEGGGGYNWGQGRTLGGN
jgi:Derlin-2/3